MQSNSPSPQTPTKFPTWATVLISVVATALVVGLATYYFVKNDEEVANNNQIVKEENSSANNNLNNGGKNFPSFFIREGNNYVLYTYKSNGKEKMGLTIPIQQEGYYDSDQKFQYQDQPLSAVTSPDGKKVAYLAKVNSKELEQYNLYIANADGTGNAELTKPEWNYAHGSIGDKFYWDLDSQNIIYADQKGDEGGTTFDIYVINVQTKVKTKVVSDSASWNPSDDNAQIRTVEIVPAGFYNR